MNFYDPLVAVYGYYSDKTAQNFGTHIFETYTGKRVEVSTVVPSHEHAKYLDNRWNYGLKFVACLARYIGPGRQN